MATKLSAYDRHAIEYIAGTLAESLTGDLEEDEATIAALEEQMYQYGSVNVEKSIGGTNYIRYEGVQLDGEQWDIMVALAKAWHADGVAHREDSRRCDEEFAATGKLRIPNHPHTTLSDVLARRDGTNVDLTADQLRQRRMGLNLTQQQLADALRVTQQTVNRWEHGERAIPSFLYLALDALDAARTNP